MWWFGLEESLSPAEKRRVRLELNFMAEAQQSQEELRLAEQLVVHDSCTSG